MKALGSFKTSYRSQKDTASDFSRLDISIELTSVWDGVRQNFGLRCTKLLGGVTTVVQTFTVRVLPCNGEEVPAWKPNYSATVSAILQLYQQYCRCISGPAAVSEVLQMYQKSCSCISSTACCSLNSFKHLVFFAQARTQARALSRRIECRCMSNACSSAFRIALHPYKVWLSTERNESF